ncbi:hypothetical protein Peur_024299 [Populus x canadensis]
MALKSNNNKLSSKFQVDNNNKQHGKPLAGIFRGDDAVGNPGETMHSFLEAQGNSLVLEYYQIMDSPKTENGWDLQRALMLAQRVFNRWPPSYLMKKAASPGSDELYDQSEIHLEKMKRALKIESLPCSRQPLMELYASPPLENQGALPVGSRSRKISHPPPLPLNYNSNQNANPPPPPPLNYGYQSTNPPPLPLNFGYQSTNYLPQSLNDGSVSTLPLYQAPTPRASVPQSTNESSVPRNNIGSSGRYGVISGGRADSFQNYGFVDPYGRANSDGENTAAGGAATSDPYWSNMEEPSHKGAKRTSSFTYSFLHGSPRFPLSAISPTPSPRPPYALLPACSIL